MSAARTERWKVALTAIVGLLILAIAVFFAAVDWEYDADGNLRLPKFLGGSPRVEFPGIEVEPGGGGDGQLPESHSHRSPPLEGPGDPLDSERR